jgi:hypothetical protein
MDSSNMPQLPHTNKIIIMIRYNFKKNQRQQLANDKVLVKTEDDDDDITQ